MFDPAQFFENEISSEMATKRVDPPAGRYNFQITEIALKKFDAKEPGGKDSYRLEFTCEADAHQSAPDGSNIAEAIGRDKFFGRYSGWADLTPSGAWELGPGKNITLGAIREATGLNVPGQPFRIGMLKGQVFNGDLYFRQDDKDPEKRYAEIRNPLPRQ
jgi:hypothetical protein